MVLFRYWLDQRQTKPGCPAPLKVSLNHHGQTALYSTGTKLLPSQWDAPRQRVINHPAANKLNIILMTKEVEIRKIIDDLMYSGMLADMTVFEMKDRIVAELEHYEGKKSATFVEVYNKIADSKSPSTKHVYLSNLNYVRRYEPKIDTMKFSSMTKEWVEGLDQFLKDNYSGNTRNCAIDTISSAGIYAVKQNLIRKNPFEVMKKQYVRTRRRDLDEGQMRKLWAYKPQTEAEEQAMDAFKFSFLCRAANTIDIADMKVSDIFNGRIEYTRAKTRKQYSIRIEPELQKIIDKYAKNKPAKGDLLLPFLDKYSSPNVCSSALNQQLRKISGSLKLPEITMYWARHSFASLAMMLEIPIETISACLGHSYGARVTVGYIDIKNKQVDDAARKVYDLVVKK